MCVCVRVTGGDTKALGTTWLHRFRHWDSVWVRKDGGGGDVCEGDGDGVVCEGDGDVCEGDGDGIMMMVIMMMVCVRVCGSVSECVREGGY